MDALKEIMVIIVYIRQSLFIIFVIIGDSIKMNGKKNIRIIDRYLPNLCLRHYHSIISYKSFYDKRLFLVYYFLPWLINLYNR